MLTKDMDMLTKSTYTFAECMYIKSSNHHIVYSVACQVSLVMFNSLKPYKLQPARPLYPWGFSRQDCWSGLPCPPPGDLLDPFLTRFFTTSATWKAPLCVYFLNVIILFVNYTSSELKKQFQTVVKVLLLFTFVFNLRSHQEITYYNWLSFFFILLLSRLVPPAFFNHSRNTLIFKITKKKSTVIYNCKMSSTVRCILLNVEI